MLIPSLEEMAKLQREILDRQKKRRQVLQPPQSATSWQQLIDKRPIK